MHGRSGLAAASVVVVLLGAWLVVQAAVSLDEEGESFGRGVIVIDGLPSGADGDPAAALTDVARRHHADMSMIRPGGSGDDVAFELVVANGRPLPLVTDTVVSTTVRPAPDQELRGWWATDEVGDDLRELSDALAGAGFSVQVDEVDPHRALVSVATSGPSLLLLGAALAVLVAAAVAADGGGDRRRGRALAGWSRRRMLLDEALAALRLSGSVAAGGALCAAVAWGVSTSFRRPDVVVPLSLDVGLSTVVVCVVVSTVARSARVVAEGEQRRSGAGRATRRPTTATSVVQVVLAAVLTIDLTVATAAAAAARSAQEHLAASSFLSDHHTLGVGIAGAVDERLEPILARITRAEFARGAAVLSDAQLVPGVLLTTHGPTTVTEPLGQVVVHPTPGAGDGGSAARDVFDRLVFSWGLQSESPPLGVSSGEGHVEAVDVSAARGVPFSPEVTAVAVFPPDAGGQSDADLAASAFNGRVLFADPSRVREALASEGAGSLVQAYDRVGDRYEAAVAESRRRLTAAVLAAAVVGSAAVVGVASGAAARATRRRRAGDALFVAGRRVGRADVHHTVVAVATSALGVAAGAGVVEATAIADGGAAVGVGVGVVLVLEVTRSVVAWSRHRSSSVRRRWTS